MTNRDNTLFLASMAKRTRFFTTRQDVGDPLADLIRAAQRPNQKELAHTVKEKSQEPERPLSQELST
jgi:hypothetical protein